MWPPGYYILRDRVPFYLTCLYALYRASPRLRNNHRTLFKAFGWYLILLTLTITAAALILCLTGKDMTPLAGISWTAPSPLEWGVYTLSAYQTLKTKSMPAFDASYLSLVTAFAGGWLYEIPRWIKAGEYAAIFNFNATKVFFIRYQIICVLIAAYIITKNTKYTPPKQLAAATLLYILFCILYATLPIDRISDRIINGSWRWLARPPTQLTMLYTLTGVGGPADE